MILLRAPRWRTRAGFHATVPLLAIASLLGPAAQASVVAGKAVSASGDVLVRNSGPGAAKMRKLKSGDEILKGDVINTSSGGSVKLLLTDKSVLDLGGSTLFKVDEYDMSKGGPDRKVAMTMEYGKVRASVNTPVGAKGKYNIRTKTATMGVRGTEFIVASDLGEIAPARARQQGSPAASAKVTTQVTVVEGKVVVADTAAPEKAPVAVKQGEQLTTVSEISGDKVARKPASEEPPKVVELSQEQIKTAVQEAKVEDKTFKQAVQIDSSGQNGPSSGLSTLSEIGSAFSASPDFAPNMGQMGAPGTFGPAVNLIQNALPQGSPINVTVVFKK